jgi:hypothetical protein
MSYWNYRVVQRKFEDGVEHAIYEVYYDDNDVPKHVTESPISLSSIDGVDGLNWTMDKIRLAFEKPVLDYDVDFSGVDIAESSVPVTEEDIGEVDIDAQDGC